MKCDHLLGRMFDGEVYILASDVMEAVAELKQKLESVQASMYCDVVDANMEVRRLRRALCLLRFAFSKLEQNYISRFEYNESKWDEMWEKRAYYWKAKAEEYK